ncbi:MAG TPA: M20 family metallopeptidase [Myxococcota bacterium]|nr:M20 family metallopeptidase [Myxococcota bacterium]
MAAPELESRKEEVCEAVDRMRGDLLRLSREIHAHPELAFEERFASARLVAALRGAGLAVTEGAYGLATAFAAEFGAPAGPRVAVLAEYDALPEIGHACGHNLIAVAGVGAGIALASLGARLPGRVRVLGTPAEERGCGKELMAREGALADVDAAMMIHPSSINLVNMPCVCMAELDVVYRGQAAHAAAMPERGINALDALVLAYQGIAALRQHIRPTERIHGIFTDGGQAPNVVPERAAGRFYVRAATRSELEALKPRVEGCFHAGAAATGADLELRWGEADYLDIRFNEPLASAFRANAERLGRQFFPYDKLPAGLQGSTDMGNVSQRVPSIHPMLAASPPHCTIHNAEFAKWAGSEMGDAAAIDGAKALAMTALDFLADADLRDRTRACFGAGG